MAGRQAGCPCKSCAQSTGRNFEDNSMEFGTLEFYKTRTKDEFGCDRSIISPTPHTNVPPELSFNTKKCLRNKFCISINLCTEFYENLSTIDHSSHIKASSENHFKVYKSHTNVSIKLIFDTNKFYISRNNIDKFF